MAVVRTLLVWVAVAECWVQHTTGSCPTGKFGDSCFYSCHCGDSCDQTTGVCGGGCDAGWVGGHEATCQKENVAYNKHATTPSGLYYHDPPWSADKAVDGNRDQDVFNNSCFHSEFKDSKAVWTVDLGQPYMIHDVRIYNRARYIARLQTAVLSLRNYSTPGATCYTFPSDTVETSNSVYDVTCNGTGRYFTITHKKQTLNLCEVEIFVCSNGTFGELCNHFCHCSDGPCGRFSGVCAGDCRPGWQGQNCSTACDKDQYGVNCNETCGNRKCAAAPSSCDRHTGSCDTGCLPGWTEVDCKQECSPGTYGQNCSLLCTDRNCAGNSSCDHVTGKCVTRCKTGWMGIDCIQACEPHRYGPNCDKACASRHCVGNSSCNSTGGCDSGCETGWTLNDCTACDSQHYGDNCVKTCYSRHCIGDSSCNTTGHCDSGCEAGWSLPDCTEAIASTGPDPDDSIPTYVGAAVGVILAALVLVLIIFIIRRRRQRERKHSNDGLVQRPRKESKAQSDAGNVYMNVGFAEEKQAQVQTKGSVGKRPSVVTLEEEDDDAHATKQQGEAPEISDRNYYNLDDAGVGHVISVSSLEAKVKDFEEVPQLVEGEFKRLPDGFIHPYGESQMPQNNGKNRFKGYYPYDNNRVVLQDDGDSGDYINASYLDGYKRVRRYIAAQGPYNSQVVVDFWRMIWKEECRTVVMVTGLVEGGKVKCLRYWPEKGTKTFGDVMVTMVSETRLSNYTITELSVESEKECKKRDVHHLNFTSWPDHGVPDTAALLDFMWRTEAISGQQTEPIVVHCSAGIGRTGTYIAIESLVEQAKSEGVVDVVSFVSNMRGQRKNMIQTKEQYLFVYQAVARAVTEGDTSLDADVLRQMDLDHVSVNFGNRTIQQHLEALRNVHERNTEGVNVRSVHSYTKRNGFFIMTSHPDKEEVWNQVYNSDSHCLLTFAVGDLSYLPSVDSPITTERLAVSMRSSTAMSHDILLNTIDINIKDCDDTTTIQHYHITGSARDPNISWLIDSFLTWTSDPQRSSSTIISDSVTDCRLLVLLLNIASRLQDDGRVDVINNMRQLYTFLGGPPFTEADVMFCLESAQRRLVSSNVYANF
ncbi:receptor-type tyrosine-protein phosphatase epsilon-like [Haliotis rufescens]|uniref:receptor-type tyrosine-protein phosphatase epsilon-like n=1 Tax=Haliotis rufescens TaxID=6454 RepID=UPI00201F1449|nr:receptor-type tyrosine-protein phosphatase epsilon-like [Haliotis rufescens]